MDKTPHPPLCVAAPSRCRTMSHSSPAELKSLIHARLTESGEKERLREHLRARLIECGWRDQVNNFDWPSRREQKSHVCRNYKILCLQQVQYIFIYSLVYRSSWRRSRSFAGGDLRGCASRTSLPRSRPREEPPSPTRSKESCSPRFVGARILNRAVSS